MSEENKQADVTKKKVVYQMPGTDAVTVRRDGEYRVTESGALTMDIYYHLIGRAGMVLLRAGATWNAVSHILKLVPRAKIFPPGN